VSSSPGGTNLAGVDAIHTAGHKGPLHSCCCCLSNPWLIHVRSRCCLASFVVLQVCLHTNHKQYSCMALVLLALLLPASRHH
jgi:hypothetical protein